MFYQIDITPKENKTKLILHEQANDYNLLLAPFQPQTRIKLETQTNTTVECKLTIKNSNNRCLKVTVNKIPPQERCITLSAKEWSIQPESIATLIIMWEPSESGTWRDMLQLSDSRHIKYDVPLILTCTDPNKRVGKKGGARIKQENLPKSRINNTDRILRISSARQKNNIPKKNKSINNIKNEPNIQKNKVPSNRGKENISNNVGFNWMLEQAKLKNQNKEQSAAVSDFSKFLDSSVFKFTPMKSKFSCFESESVCDTSTFTPKFGKNNESWMFQQESSTVIIENKTKTALKKETYVKVPKCMNISSSSETSFSDKNSEEFDDSLSPKQIETEIEKPKSEISTLFEDIKFTPLKNLNIKINDTKFSPNFCSTSSKSNRRKSFDDNSINYSVNKNATFDIDSVNISEKNHTFELHASPKNSFHLKPICLVKTFDKNYSDVGFSPLPGHNDSNNINNCSKFNNQFSKSQVDFCSARDCLEADLWVKSKNTSLSPTSKNFMHSTLDSIKEEDIFNYNSENKKNIYTKEDPKTEFKISKNICIEISPPKKYVNNKTSIRKVSPRKKSKIIKEKSMMETVNSKKKAQINKSIKNDGKIQIPGVIITKLSLTGLRNNKDKNKSKPIKKQSKEVGTKLHDPNEFLSIFYNPDPFAATTTNDPFLTSTFYYDNKWIFIQELEFKKWLNALLTPLENLTCDVESGAIDIGKVWQSCRGKENCTLAETKESVSARYHTNTRLNTLRKAACVMFRKSEVITALSQTTVAIEKEVLLIRPDKDLHRDIGLQKTILELFLSYNPLWLRIGLETIYGETIPLQSNNDLIGLSRFLLNRFFSDPFLVKTHSSHLHPNIRLNTFQPLMNKFMLKKFLFVVYFLDYAKRNKLIGHDPCLFHKKALIKDSRSILLTFSRELLSGIGDITKVLRNCSYVVSHEQTYLDEYDYAVTNLCTDLRDGVKLCRVMELITGKRCLTCRCRVPAISRLQKVFNVNMALSTLNEADYIITGDIDAKSIADGHREKTLSLLWQIIYKFQAPRFEKAAKTLQRWWRSKLWRIYIKNILRNRRNNAASTIQRAWKCYMARRELQILKKNYVCQLQRKIEAAQKIQSKWRLKKKMKEQKMHYQNIKISIVKIQKWWRRIQSTKEYVKRLKKMQEVIVYIQQHWRAKQLMKFERNRFLHLRRDVIKIQKLWRARLVGKQIYQDYQNKRKLIIFMQRKWRAKLLMKLERNTYLKKLKTIKFIQYWWRLILRRKAKARQQFLWQKKQHSSIVIQKNWKSYLALKEYKKKKRAAIIIQQWIRCIIIGKKIRSEFITFKQSIIKIQSFWRMTREMKKYKHQRAAALVIQKNWKSYLALKEYKKKKRAAIIIQQWIRCIIIGKKIRSEFITFKQSIIKIQSFWRMTRDMKKYKHQRAAALVIQKNWKSYLALKEYKKKKRAAIIIQQWIRCIIIGKKIRSEFITFKQSIIKIQSFWRMNRDMKKYKHQRAAALVIQKNWKSYLALKEYLKKRHAALIIQRWRRNCVRGRNTRFEFLKLKEITIKMQNLWRVKKEMRSYRRTRDAAITIQKYWKRFIAMKEYNKKKKAVLVIENWRKNILIRKKTRAEFIKLKLSVLKLQQLFRVKLQVKKFRSQRNAAIKIQRFWRSIHEMRKCKIHYQKQKLAAIILQRRYRAKIVALQIRKIYCAQIMAVNRIKKWWRKIMHNRKLKALKLKQIWAVNLIETWWMKTFEKLRIREAERAKLKKQCDATIRIQAAWRGYKVRQTASKTMTVLRERANKAAKAAVPSATLAFRLQETIEIFECASSIGQLSLCLSSLDIITSLSPNACINVCRLNLVHKLYHVLTQANRSLPWLDVCLKDINILLTLAKFKHTISYVIDEQYIDVLARLLTISVNKKEDLFLHTATLIWILTENDEYAEAARSCSHTKYLLSSLYISIIKKFTKTNLNIMKLKEEALPSSKPDWGLRHKRPRTFSNVYQAITAIASRLRILNIVQAPDMQRSFNFSI